MQYVVSDLHGNGLLWDKIKEKLNVDDTLYFLGDAIDRGPDGLYIMLDMLNNPRVTYIKGNHEQFAIDFLRATKDVESLNDVSYNIMSLWSGNGGTQTINDIWGDLTKEEAWQLYLCLKNLPEKLEVTVNGTTFLLSHAGYTPRYLTRDLATDKQVLLWNREHFMDAWEDGEDTIMLHGHTPVGYLEKLDWIGEGSISFNHNAFITDAMTKEFEPIIYADGHKIDLDLCSAFSNRAALYCLETKTWEIIDVNDLMNSEDEND